jgi:hypothetical protein
MMDRTGSWYAKSKNSKESKNIIHIGVSHRNNKELGSINPLTANPNKDRPVRFLEYGHVFTRRKCARTMKPR